MFDALISAGGPFVDDDLSRLARPHCGGASVA